MRVALIGLGMVADTHLAAIHASDAVSLHGVLGRRPDTTRAYAQKASAATGRDVLAYSSVQAVAEDADVDFIILATPPDSRMPIVKVLAAAGKPILMEKPIERTLSAARDLVAHCEHKNVRLGMVLQHRARAVSRHLKDAIEAGDLGTLVALDVRVPWWRDQSYYGAPGRGTYARDGGGVLITQAIHSIDLALWLAGPMDTVQALVQRTDLHSMEAEDWAGAVFKTKGGAVGSLMATTAAYPGDAESITLHGTKGSAALRAGTLQLWRFGEDTQTYGADAASGGGADPMAFTHAWHQSIMEDFVSALHNQSEPVATGRSALLAHAAIDAMERSSASGERVSVNLP